MTAFQHALNGSLGSDFIEGDLFDITTESTRNEKHSLRLTLLPNVLRPVSILVGSISLQRLPRNRPSLNPCRTCCLAGACQFFQRRAGGHDIVEQGNVLACDAR